jgi:RNA:NAD 2'-phosphotransferase (TPT1/KptA family)
MDRARRVRVSKLLSFGLRHDPFALGLELDNGVWLTAHVPPEFLEPSG